jgi:hypothetical protein
MATEKKSPTAKMAELIHSILSGLGLTVQMYDEKGKPTQDFNEVKRFVVTGTTKSEKLPVNLTVVFGETRGSSPKPSVTIIYPAGTDVRQALDLQSRLKASNTHGFTLNVHEQGKNIEAKHVAESTLTGSSWTGSTRTSRCKIGMTEVVIRHSSRLDDCENPRRWTRIANIFIHGADGSRYKFPFKHILGAKAMAQHMDQSGAPWDDRGGVIQNILDTVMQLRKLKRWCNSQPNPELSSSVETIQNDLKNLLKKISQPHTYSNALDQADQIGQEWHTMSPMGDTLWPENLDKAVKAVQSYLPTVSQPDHMDSMDFVLDDMHQDQHMDDELPDAPYREEREIMEWFKQFDVNQIFEVEQDDLDAAVEVSTEETGSDDPVDVLRDIKDTVIGLDNKFEKDPESAMNQITATIEKLKKLEQNT